MKLRPILLSLSLILTSLLPVMAQQGGGMTDQQVMQFMYLQNERGASRSDIVSSLIRKGVSIEQIRRIRARYEEQKKGQNTNGARNISGVENNASRMRQNNAQPGKTSRDAGAFAQQRARSKDVNTAGMSKQQRQRYEDERKSAYMDEMTSLLPDSLEKLSIYDDSGELKLGKQVFGRNIFNNKQLSFEPNMNIATPADYRLGPGDVVFIDVYGASQERYQCTVSPEGVIDIDNYGPVSVDGLTVAQANARLKATLGSRFSGSNVRLTVGQTRTITVDVMGEVNVPGTYTLSAFATVFNALYMAGGVNDIGTLRNIKIYRKKKLISTCDIYAYILDGDMKGNVRLQPGDVIIVGPYDCLVNVTGKVKRPMYYEMKSHESVGTLIKYAGGFTGDAYTKNLHLVRKKGGEMSVYTIDEFERNKFQLADGDSVSVDSTLNRFRNMVEIKGAVMRPGMYQMDGNVTTVRQLIEEAGGLREDAVTTHATMHRRKADRSLEVVRIDPQGILDHKVADVSLKNEDVLFIPSTQLAEGMKILTIGGEVQYPGTYEYADNTTLEDLVLQAGGLKDAASMMKVDVSRRIRDKKALQAGSQISQSFSFSLQNGFVIEGEPGFVLQPYDEVYVRRSPGYIEQQHVSVSGEITFAGTYALSSKGMRLSDLVKAAGGLTGEAYAEGAHLERTLTPEEKLKQQSMLQMVSMGDKTDSLNIVRLQDQESQSVGINLKEALANPGSNRYDIVLRDGDRLVIPQYNNTVSINGQVNYPNTVGYVDKARLSYYIDQAGGFGQRAKTRRVFAINMNGTVTRIRSSKDITPGCTILVPSKEKRRGVNLSEILALGSMTATLGMVVATLVK